MLSARSVEQVDVAYAIRRQRVDRRREFVVAGVPPSNGKSSRRSRRLFAREACCCREFLRRIVFLAQSV